MGYLDGQVVVVTGGGAGIGAGCAARMAREGAQVVVAGRHGDKAEAVAAEIVASGYKARGQHVDIADLESVRNLMASVVRDFGRIDGLVNTAAVRRRGYLLDMTDDNDWHEVIAVNVTGTMYVAREAARHMVAQKSGTILLLSSDRGTYGQERGANYAASKGAVNAFAKSLALELGPHGVTVNALNPGTTPTSRAHESQEEQRRREELLARRAAEDPLGRLSTVDELAEYITWLVGIGGKFITGQLVTTRMRKG